MDATAVLDRILAHNTPAPTPGAQGAPPAGAYLLSQVFPEGSPTRPACPSGHATVAGACATVPEAWFDEAAPMTDPANRLPTDPGSHPLAFQASDPDGGRLVPAAEQVVLTIGGELNKFASNIALGRNGAGVHWRSDATEGMKLGEAAAAAGILFEQAFTFEEEHSLSFTTFFTKERVTIGRRAGAGGGAEVFVRFVDVDHSVDPPRETGRAQEEVFPAPGGA